MRRFDNFAPSAIGMDQELAYLLFDVQRKNPTFLQLTSTALIGADFGSGRGDSADLLLRLCPHLQLLHAIDSTYPHTQLLLLEKRETVAVQQHATSIFDFMNSFAGETIHIAMMSLVPSHGIPGVDGYQKLAALFAPSGLLIEASGTDLDRGRMEKFFDTVHRFGRSDVIWRKR